MSASTDALDQHAKLWGEIRSLGAKRRQTMIALEAGKTIELVEIRRNLAKSSRVGNTVAARELAHIVGAG